MKKSKKPIKKSNAVEAANSTSKDFGFIPVPCKGGKTLNAEIPKKKED